MWREPSISDIADDVRQCLSSGDRAMAIRLAYRFVERYDRSAPDVREHMVSSAPDSTGNERFDALLAAVVEYSCAVHHVTPPRWVEHASRFLPQFWFVAELPLLEAEALVSSPISFARRGIFINSGDLSYA